MTIKYTEEEFEKAKSTDLLSLECEHCGKIFLKAKKEIVFELKHPERRRCRFCSIKCSDEHHKDGQMHFEKCTNCGKEIIVKECEYKKSKTKHFFCSNSCSASYNNKHRNVIRKHISIPKIRTKIRICAVCGCEYVYQSGLNTKKFCSHECYQYYKKHRVDFLSEDSRLKLSIGGRKSMEKQKEFRRSKNEKYFCKLCEKHFTNVKHNETIFNGWDADIILNDQKLAILWNGPWHYKEISKKISLSQIQNRDKIKIYEIEKNGYRPYIIKDMGKYNPKFVEKQFEILLEYLNSGVK